MAGTDQNIVGIQEDSFAIDASHAPEYVLVTTYGALDKDHFQRISGAIGAVMDEKIGPGRAFCPIIFDMTCSRLAAQLSLPEFREAGRPFMRRYRTVIFVCSEVTQTDLFEFMMAVFAALVKGTRHATSVDAALALLDGVHHTNNPGERG